MNDFSAMVAYGLGTMILKRIAVGFVVGIAIGLAAGWYFL